MSFYSELELSQESNIKQWFSDFASLEREGFYNELGSF